MPGIRIALLAKPSSTSATTSTSEVDMNVHLGGGSGCGGGTGPKLEIMKIHVSKIPEEGLELREKLDPKKLTLDTESINFTDSVDVKARVTKVGKELLIDIMLDAPVEYTCARCLSKFEKVFHKECKLNREVKAIDTVEIDDDIRQEMILDYPMKVVCRESCKGLCPNCGQNLNVGECECR